MANTLNLGGGKWATKEGSLLAYNSENNNYKPLPFTFDRASTATRVNKDGLIETVGNNIPRIDYSSGEGSLLLEPQSTNLLLQSNQFDTTWAKSSGVTITSEQTISPQGTNNGWKFEKTAFSYKSIGQNYTSSSETTFSIFAKKGTLSVITLFANINGGNNLYQRFDLENGIVSTGSGMSSSNIKDYGNGWYRCSSTFTNTNVISLDYFPDFGETEAGYIYIWGAQAEALSYATSYIKTEGSAVTRLADSCYQTVPDGVIGQTEGTIFTEINIKSTESIGVYSGWKIDGTSGNQIAFITYPNGRIQATVFDSGSLVVNINDNNYGLTSGVHKIAFAYKQNDYILYVDGSIVGSDTSATVPVVKDFDISYLNLGSLKYNETKLYNKRLSNTELQALTT